ncbi:hypothetical protein F5Y17DRAFT_246626 [Xylariaceae sp. FL0594]|nr:hypothetical protein F5Y17DRAFT_246626 [Xylariaceae sp. FL0594]
MTLYPPYIEKHAVLVVAMVALGLQPPVAAPGGAWREQSEQNSVRLTIGLSISITLAPFPPPRHLRSGREIASSNVHVDGPEGIPRSAQAPSLEIALLGEDAPGYQVAEQAPVLVRSAGGRRGAEVAIDAVAIVLEEYEVDGGYMERTTIAHASGPGAREALVSGLAAGADVGASFAY